MEEKAARFVESLLGKTLTHFCCEVEILDFSFGPLALHAMGGSRIIQNNEILATVPDYQCWDGEESKNNDEWYNAKRFCAQIVGGTVCAVSVSPWNDLRLALDNGVLIECLIANAAPHYGEEQEQWVLFEPTKDHSGAFLTVYNKTVEFIEGRGTAGPPCAGR